MRRCMISYGSCTAKWLAAATQSQSTRTSSFSVRTRWELSRACQKRGLSSTNQPASQSDLSGTGKEIHAESTTSIAVPGRGASSVDDGTFGQDEFSTSNPLPSVDVEIDSTDSTCISNVSAAEPPSGTPGKGNTPPFKRRPLPLSPLMDPAFLEARQKHHAPKLPPSKTPTPFQQQLAKNPFALALASPVRRCAVSGIRLPSFFLQDFRVMSDPATGDPWYVPASLASKHLFSPKEREILDEIEESKEAEDLEASTKVENLEASARVADVEGLEKEEGLEKSEEFKKVVAVGKRPMPSKFGFRAYTLNRKVVLQCIVDKSTGSKQSLQGQISIRLMPPKWRGLKSAMASYGKSGWRQDMEKFVPMLMRRRISEALVHLCGLKRGYLVGCSDWECALQKPQVAAFLWTGQKGDGVLEGPPEFATLDVGSQDFDVAGPQLGRKKRKVPVYNLQTLLGKEKMDELRQLVPKSVFEMDIVALRHKNVTVELQSQLWRIQGYVADHRDNQVTRPESDMENTTDASEAISEPAKLLY